MPFFNFDQKNFNFSKSYVDLFTYKIIDLLIVSTMKVGLIVGSSKLNVNTLPFKLLLHFQ